MNKQSLNERILQAMVYNTKHISTYEPHMKNLIVNVDDMTSQMKEIIRDVITEVLPGRGRIEPYTEQQDTFGHGYNHAIDTIQKNVEELGL